MRIRGKLAGNSPLPQDVANEGQTARLAAQRTAANLQEERLRGLKAGGIEFADEGLALVAAILRNRLDQVAAQILQAAEIGDRARPQLLRQSKFCARHQPVREVIPLSVVRQTLFRNRMQQGLQGIQVSRAPHLRAIRMMKHEIAEAHFLRQNAAQIAEQRGRALLQKSKAFAVRPLAELGAAGLQHDGNVGNRLAHHARQFETCFGSQFPAARKLHIRNNSQQVLAILQHLALRIFVVGAQQDLRSSPHANQFVRDVQCLVQQPPRLADDLRVNHRQKQRVVRNVVLHQQEDGNIHRPGCRAGRCACLRRS